MTCVQPYTSTFVSDIIDLTEVHRPNLCRYCTGAFSELELEQNGAKRGGIVQIRSQYHPSAQSLIEAINTGCHLCAINENRIRRDHFATERGRFVDPGQHRTPEPENEPIQLPIDWDDTRLHISGHYDGDVFFCEVYVKMQPRGGGVLTFPTAAGCKNTNLTIYNQKRCPAHDT